MQFKLKTESYSPVLSPFHSLIPVSPFDFRRVHKLEPNMKGLYALFNEGNLVYIGWSTDIRNRIYKHRASKVFDAIRMIDLPEDYERRYIMVYLPKYNEQHRKRV